MAEQFYDYEYICFQDNGKSYTKELIYESYKKMLSKCNLPELKWHELRHTYSTLLAQHGVSMKAISVCMGHFSEGFTRAIYVVPERIIFDAVEEITQFANEVLLSKEVETKVEISEKYVLEVLPQSHYNKVTKKLSF